MIPRYAPRDMAALFSDVQRFDAMLDVEILAAEALAELGVIPSDDARALRERRPVIDDDFVRAVEEREAVTQHDTAAFVDVVQERIGMPEGAWIHYGLTSSDVVDTALCSILTRAMGVVLEDARAFRDALADRARESIDLPIVGRTHGMHAEPTTYGTKFALFALQTDRDLRRAQRARDGIAVGKLSGAVGTYSNIDPSVEDFVCDALGLTPTPATQVIARDRHAEVLYACAALGTAVEQFALEVRHLARSEVGEAREPFRAGQKGSSAMPHKRNPVLSERLCGLARVLRGYLQAGLEDVALWHERDISHSSVERVILPDALTLTVYMVRQATSLARGLVLVPERARENLEATSLGLVFSQSVLLALVDGGHSRDEAYRLVQDAAARAVESKTSLRDVVAGDARMALSADQLESAFSIERVLRHRRRILNSLEFAE
ncbi:MAG: adenylosuccinate lyase [Acidobacteria bacterium]|nr:adenylosuccinate lyase [Acidobacteriota bacterium]